MCEKCSIKTGTIEMTINGTPTEEDKKTILDFIRLAQAVEKTKVKQDEILKMKETDWEDVRNTIINL